MQNLVRIYVCSAGTIFLFVATALCLSNRTIPADMVSLSDPIFHVPLPRLFWIVAAVATAVALVCLFTHQTKVQVALVVLGTSSFLACRLWVAAADSTTHLGGYLGRLGSTFGIEGTTADGVLTGLGGYLLAGSVAALFLLRRPAPVAPTGSDSKRILDA